MSLNYLVVGHITKDLLPGGDGNFTMGGTVTYASRTVLALGHRAGVITSVGPDLDIDLVTNHVMAGCEVIDVPSDATTTFANIYKPSGRVQFVYATAAPLGLEAVPAHWQKPDIVHLGPLVKECQPELVHAFPGALKGITPQGWMRTWDEQGRVSVSDWPAAEEILPYVDAVVLSRADVGESQAAIDHLASLAPVLVETLGVRGCLVYTAGEVHHVPVAAQPEVDPTGAGDIFAAAFFVYLRQGGDPCKAAHLANRVAALSVGRTGYMGTPTRQEIEMFIERSA